jgi:UDP-glucuronate 4-epimerase
MKTILVTGCHGFIGYSLCMSLLQNDPDLRIIGIDKERDAISHKEARVRNLKQHRDTARNRFVFLDINLSDFEAVERVVTGRSEPLAAIIHLAGQYSVHHNTANARSYVEGNVVGFSNLIECARLGGVKRFIYASSTWVQDGQLPTSLYAATKRYNEESAHVYSSQFDMTTVGLRIASTYGPYVRPDIGMYQVMRWLMNRTPINIEHPSFSGGIGFVYINDVVEAIKRFMTQPLPLEPGHHVHTIVANDESANMGHVLELLECVTGIQHNAERGELRLSKREFNGKVIKACARLDEVLGWHPSTTLEQGIPSFVEWFNSPENIPPN